MEPTFQLHFGIPKSHWSNYWRILEVNIFVAFTVHISERTGLHIQHLLWTHSYFDGMSLMILIPATLKIVTTRQSTGKSSTIDANASCTNLFAEVHSNHFEQVPGNSQYCSC